MPLIQKMGLPWEDACLSPEKSRVSRTASAMQVSKPVYTGSSEKWREFEPYLGPVFASLHKPDLVPESDSLDYASDRGRFWRKLKMLIIRTIAEGSESDGYHEKKNSCLRHYLVEA